MDEHAFEDMIREIQKQGYDAATAARLAALIGDLPIKDEQGRLVVLDETKRHVVARLQWTEWFGR